MTKRITRHILISTAGKEGAYTNDQGKRINFRGFKTRTRAKGFIRGNGGILCTLDDAARGNSRGREYMAAAICGGLDADMYPCCVLWEN